MVMTKSELVSALKHESKIVLHLAGKCDRGKLDFDGVVKQIAALPATYEKLLGHVPDADFRTEIRDFEGQPTSRGAFLVELALGGHAAYRTQLFLYLKSCGQEELDSSNLWNGVDGKKP